MKKYRKKHINVEAVQWDGRLLEGMFPIAFFKDEMVNWHYQGQTNLIISNLNTGGKELACYPGFYIVKEHDGYFSVCTGSQFKELYEEIE
jgi:hypothetical protein